MAANVIKETDPPETINTVHWADHAAEDLIEKQPDQKRFVCAAGISPSGVVHIGNFREVITAYFVVQALRERGKEVHFIYSWDDYDALRKVPKNLPNPALIEENLRRPISKIPDPFGTDTSYAAHFERMFEQSLQPLEVDPTYIRQNEPYRRGDYAKGICDALQSEKEIVKILNEFRTEPLPADWRCVTIYCKQCDRDTTEILSSTMDGKFKYRCTSCKSDLETSVDQAESGIKLLWRVDWPMRWTKEQVDFEPGGKDHSSRGGSYETGGHIVRKVWHREPPHYVQYDFVLAKGLGAKISSSSGESASGTLITLEQALTVYEPAVMRWIFASRKPNIDFSIAFDLEVLKAYDDFDRTTRIALGLDPEDEKKANYENRIYAFSRTSIYPKSTGRPQTLVQFPFRHLCNLLQINEGDLEKTAAFYKTETLKSEDKQRFDIRASCAWKWITDYAPKEFRFQVRADSNPPPPTKLPQAVSALVTLLESPVVEKISEDGLAQAIYPIIKGNGLEPKAFFQEVYQCLIDKPNGPKLASFLLALTPARAATLLKRAL